jgi:ketosteroid isomerase-like protein
MTAADRAELSDLVARYALLVDRRDLDGVAELFTEDGVLVLPGLPGTLEPTVVVEGRAGIRATLTAVERVPQTFHAVVGEVHENTADPDVRRGAVACTAHHYEPHRDGGVVDRVWHLRYSDTYRRGGEGWRIARRELQLGAVELHPVKAWRGEPHG